MPGTPLTKTKTASPRATRTPLSYDAWIDEKTLREVYLVPRLSLDTALPRS